MNMECVVCFEASSELHFRACCNHVICQVCLDDIMASGGRCLCQQKIKVVSWESYPVCIQELASKLAEQVRRADEWFWSTQHREFLDMPSWEEYINAFRKSLIDYVEFLDRVDAYQVHDRYPQINDWKFNPPGKMYYAQVYTNATYKKLVKEGLFEVTHMMKYSDLFQKVKIQTPEICLEACKINHSNLLYVKEPTVELYTKLFLEKKTAFFFAVQYGHENVIKSLINDIPRPKVNWILKYHPAQQAQQWFIE